MHLTGECVSYISLKVNIVVLISGFISSDISGGDSLRGGWGKWNRAPALVRQRLSERWCFLMFLIVCIFVHLYSVPDLGELLQCALGDQDPGCFHCRKTPRSGTHHSCWTRPNLSRWTHIHLHIFYSTHARTHTHAHRVGLLLFIRKQNIWIVEKVYKELIWIMTRVSIAVVQKWQQESSVRQKMNTFSQIKHL